MMGEERDNHQAATEVSVKVDAMMLIWQGLPIGVRVGIVFNLLDGVLANDSDNLLRAEMAARYPLTLKNLSVAMPHFQFCQEDIEPFIADNLPKQEAELDAIAETMRSHLVEDWFHEELSYHLQHLQVQQEGKI